jgi:CMP/dCMP kinase
MGNLIITAWRYFLCSGVDKTNFPGGYDMTNGLDSAKHVNIAIDGPAGAGKSTLSKMLAAHHGYIYVDTGALYRAVGLSALRADIVPSDAQGVEGLLTNTSIELKFKDSSQRVLLNGEDVTALIRSPEVSMAASQVSAIPKVRAFLLGLQKTLAEKNNVVMDGRDIGTVVLPGAKIKIFLTASPQDRARRRYDEMRGRGETDGYDKVLEDINKRDDADSGRGIAPLKPAQDAIIVDTTGFELENSLDKLTSIVKEHLK